MLNHRKWNDIKSIQKNKEIKKNIYILKKYITNKKFQIQTQKFIEKIKKICKTISKKHIDIA